VVFEVSSNLIRTFHDLKRTGEARWANHDVLYAKPKPEFLGPGQEEITFSVRLSAQLGVNPKAELERLRKMRDTGQLAPFIVGGQPVSQNLWLLESIQEGHKTHSGNGILLQADVDLTLKEYPAEGGKGK